MTPSLTDLFLACLLYMASLQSNMCFLCISCEFIHLFLWYGKVPFHLLCPYKSALSQVYIKMHKRSSQLINHMPNSKCCFALELSLRNQNLEIKRFELVCDKPEQCCCNHVSQNLTKIARLLFSKVDQREILKEMVVTFLIFVFTF